MEESECLVCFSRFDDEDHRPRFMPCGHTMCSVCLERAIREDSKMCPKCRTIYSASNVEDFPVNFSLESMMKSTNISKCNKADNLPVCVEHQFPVNKKLSAPRKENALPECVEHQLPVTNRCSTHKSWVCQSCLGDDHSSESCKIITIREGLNDKITIGIDKSQTFLDEFDETCKKSDDCKKQCKKIMNDCEEDIFRYETMVKKLQEEIQKKKNSRIQLEENCLVFDQKVDNLISKRHFYDQAVVFLRSSETIREMSRGLDEVQNEAKKLQWISQLIENEMDLMLQGFKAITESNIGLSLGNHKLSVRDGKTHLHVLQGKNTSKCSPYNLQFTDENDPILTKGILTFLDLVHPGQEPQRVYIKMLGNTARARQHLLLVTGQCGYSYKNLKFYSPHDQGKPGENIVLQPYDGKNASPLFEDVTINDVVNHEKQAGFVTGAGWNKNFNTALIGVFLRDDPGITSNLVFGFVTSGLEILQEFAKSDKRENIKVIDCGIILF